MKVRPNYYYFAVVLLVGAAFLAAWQVQISAKSDGKPIQIKVSIEKENYSLGEPIGLRFDIANVSEESVMLSKPSSASGNIRVFISNDGETFAEYEGPGWGSLNSGSQKMKLDIGEVYSTKAKLLYNQTVQTEHLTPLYADKIRKERVDSEFAMPEAGHYWLKAIFTEGSQTFRSESVEIDVTVPVGSDAAVWEQIKTDGAFAYFLHTGEIKYLADSAEATGFEEKLANIARDYPNTYLAERLSENLVKYNRNIEYVQRIRAEREAAQ